MCRQHCLDAPTAMTITFTAPDRVRINSREVLMRTADPPMRDGSTHYVEATSDIRNKYQPTLFVSELSDIPAGTLPKGFQINIYLPEARCYGVDFFKVENLVNGLRLVIHISWAFEDWT